MKLALIVILMFFMSCGYSELKKQPQQTTQSGSSAGDVVRVTAQRALISREATNPNDDTNQRFVQYRAELTLVHPKPDTIRKNLMTLIQNLEGYILYSENDRITFRIPSAKFESTLKLTEKLGEITEKRVFGEDVTESYYDLNIRLDHAKKVHQRYIDLLQKAVTVDEVLKVERELERLSREIDLLQGKLNRMTHLVKFSTITVTTKTPVKPGPIGYAFYGLYLGIKWFFVSD